MNIIRHYKFFDFEFLKQIVDLDKVYIGINFMEDGGLELVLFTRENFKVCGFLFFEQSKDMYIFKNYIFNSEFYKLKNTNFLSNFLELNISPKDLISLRNKKIIEYNNKNDSSVL